MSKITHKLTREQANYARQQVAEGVAQTDVARELGVTQAAIWAIVNNKVHVSELRQPYSRAEALQRRRDGRFFLEYGISRAEWEGYLDIIGRQCEACGSSDALVCDHDHATGEIRGALCSTCNTALGMLRDDPGVILRLHSYLIRPLRLKEEAF